MIYENNKPALDITASQKPTEQSRWTRELKNSMQVIGNCSINHSLPKPVTTNEIKVPRSKFSVADQMIKESELYITSVHTKHERYP